MPLRRPFPIADRGVRSVYPSEHARRYHLTVVLRDCPALCDVRQAVWQAVSPRRRFARYLVGAGRICHRGYRRQRDSRERGGYDEPRGSSFDDQRSDYFAVGSSCGDFGWSFEFSNVRGFVVGICRCGGDERRRQPSSSRARAGRTFCPGGCPALIDQPAIPLQIIPAGIPRN